MPRIPPDANLVSITASASDILLPDFLENCSLPSNNRNVHPNDHACEATLSRMQQATKLGGSIETDTGSLISAVKRRAPHAKVVLMGFPRLIGSPASKCGAFGLGNRADEFSARILDLNSALERAANTNGVAFGNLDGEFGSGPGRRYCDEGGPIYFNEMDARAGVDGRAQWDAGYWQPTIDGQGVFLNLLRNAWQGN